MTIAAALATFNDSAKPFIGIETVFRSAGSSGNPLASLPNIQTDGPAELCFMNVVSRIELPLASRA
jgi:hypothetical protein